MDYESASLPKLDAGAGVQRRDHPEIQPGPETVFRETGAPDLPDKQTVAAWRDSLVQRGYSAASVNAMLAAVNGYQECCGNPQGKAKPLKCQRRVFCDAGRELNRAEYFRLLEAARQTGRKRTLLLLQTLCATGIRVSELPYITAEAVHRGRAAIRCKGKCREILLPGTLCKRLERWCRCQRIHGGPVFVTRTGHPLDRVTVWKEMKALCKQAGVAKEKVFPHNLRHLFARTFYEIEKILPSWRTCWVIPVSKQHASILWNPAPNISACWNRCTCFCNKENKSTVLLQKIHLICEAAISFLQ